MTTVTNLSSILDRWILRLRWQRALAWSLRGLIIGLALALTIGLTGLYREQLLREEFLILVVGTALFAPLISGVIAFLWLIPPLQAARHFDLVFQLDERVSTALELQVEGMQIPTELIRRQLQDAVTASSQVDAGRSMPLRWNLREALVAFAIMALIGTVWLRGDQWFDASRRAREVERAVAEQAAEIEELIQEITANEALTEKQKELLTSALKEAQQNLNDNPSLENSVSVLTSTGEKLQALSDAQSQEMSQALKEAGGELAAQDDSPLQSVGSELTQGDYVSAASKLKDIDLNELSPQEQAQLADQLEALANSLQATNPQLASQLRQAAESIRSGDVTAAQQALDETARSLAQAGQQITFSQTASQAGSQLQQGAGQVLAAGGGAQQANGIGQGQGENSGQDTNGLGGSGAGTGSGDESSQMGDEAGSDPIDQNSGPGDGGEESYEQIYAPTLLGGEGGPDVGLPNSGNGEGDVIGQGPTAPGADGTSLVPYDEVYSQYQNVNNQAIENGEVPNEFIEIIKNYFDSLEP